IDPVTQLPIIETLEHTSSGEPSVGNPFFNSDVDLLSRSDIMRQGPQELFQPFPSLNTVSVFSRLPLMVGDTNQDPTFQQNAYDYLTNLTDWIGPNTLIAIGAGNALIVPNIGYITGSGANNHISLVNDPANPGMILVTIDAYRDTTYTPSALIESFSYDIDPTAISTLMIENCGGDCQLDLDTSLPGLAALNIEIFGGIGVNNVSFVDDGTHDVAIQAANLNAFTFTGVERFDTRLQVTGLGSLLQFHLQDFQ